MLLLAAAWVCASACDPLPPTSNQDCELRPPQGRFDAPLMPGKHPGSIRLLPTNPGASSVLIEPARRHRWASKQGLVETRDGSLLLHGVIRAPGEEPEDLTLTVLLGYEPAEARLTVWTADRRTKISETSGTHLVVALEDPIAAFDIELPSGTVPIGRWQEVQTILMSGASAPDVRRWTLYAGPNPPDPKSCVAGRSGLSNVGGRSSLGADGRLTVVAPRAASLAIVPVDKQSGPGKAQFFELAKGQGLRTSIGAEVEAAAVFEGPFEGPQKRWISTLWSATRSKAVSAEEVR